MKPKLWKFFVVLLLFGALSSFSCVDTIGFKDKSGSKVETVSEERLQAKEIEQFIVEGWVTNTHVEYFHTIIGLKTKDGKLLNLIFPGIYMQFGAGLYYRITYHRLNDTGYLPELMRNQKANYFYLDNAELLDNNAGANK